jgi:hypothetical protein
MLLGPSIPGALVAFPFWRSRAIAAGNLLGTSSSSRPASHDRQRIRRADRLMQQCADAVSSARRASEFTDTVTLIALFEAIALLWSAQGRGKDRKPRLRPEWR